MQWKHGYFADSGYTFGVYPETMPWRLRWAAMLQGQVTPAEGFRYLDAGCGQGLNLIMAALSHPDSEFVGIDFLPDHIAHARALARSCGLSNVRFIEQDFVTLAAEPHRLGEFDYVVAHGISTWVAPQVKEALTHLISQVLLPGGLCYNSYNTYPGWLGLGPFQHLVLLEQRYQTGAAALQRARQIMGHLQTHAPGLAQQLPQMTNRLKVMDQADPAYLVQEYNNQHWQPVYVSQMIDSMAAVKLSYLGTATLPDAFEAALSSPLRELLAAQSAPSLREQLRDYALVQSFRRDLYVKGRTPSWPLALLDTIGTQRFRANPLMPLPAEGEPFVVTGGAIELKGAAERYLPVYQCIHSAGANGIEVARMMPDGASSDLSAIVQILSLLLHGGWLLPVVDARAKAADGNRALAGAVCQGAPYRYLAVPGAASAIAMTDTDWLLYDLETRDVPKAQWPDQLKTRLAALNKQLARDGKPLTEPKAVHQRIQELIDAYALKHQLLVELGGA
ncbi:MAG: hypothetical protein C1943_11310 [Halochromatium sp.]|nr:hypothetical protein [Halochromatium sp.]